MPGRAAPPGRAGPISDRQARAPGDRLILTGARARSGAAKPLTVRPHADVRRQRGCLAKAQYPHVVGVEDFFA
jgi:hypothetical protein